MRDRTKIQERRIFSLNAIIAGVILISTGTCRLAGSSPKPAQLNRRKDRSGIIWKDASFSIEAPKQQVTVDAGDIPGFMAAMTMGYSVKNPNLLTPLSPEDKITADVVVNGNDVYLENIVVVKKRRTRPKRPPKVTPILPRHNLQNNNEGAPQD